MNTAPTPISPLPPIFVELMASQPAGAEVLRRTAYIAALVRMDWFFEWSDDRPAYQAGRARLAELKAEQEQIDADGALWNRHAAPEYRIKAAA